VAGDPKLISLAVIRVLTAVHEACARAERKAALALRAAYRAANICSGCGAPIAKCGPALWARARMCCRDCSHVDPKGRAGKSVVSS